MLEILKYDFFQNAIYAGILVSMIGSILGTMIVFRREANIIHSVSEFSFLGVVIGLLVGGSLSFFAIIFSILSAFLLFFTERLKSLTSESSREIISQTGFGLAIFLITFLGSVKVDILNFLFGSILTINTIDLQLLFAFLIIIIILLKLYLTKFLSIIISEDIAISKGLKTDRYKIIFLILVSFFIGISIKMFGVILLSAFLTIPANIGKNISTSLKGVFIVAFLSSLFSVISGLFVSYYLGSSSGASIVLILILLFIFSVIYRSVKK